MEMTGPLEARPPNWLPVPGARRQVAEAAPHVEEDDVFPKGQILSFFPRQGVGTLKSDRGETFPFSLAEIDLVGPKGQRRYVASGARVGFDVSWTSHGLRISRMKIY